jgi:hypothetical protein
MKIVCAKPTETSCVAAEPDKAMLLADIVRAADNGRLTVATMHVDDPGAHAALCAAAQHGAQLSLLLDRNLFAKEHLRWLASCAGPLGRFEARYFGDIETSGRKTTWRLQHAKFLLAEPPAGPARIGISTGNLSEGAMTDNVELWLDIGAPRTSSFYRTHICMAEAFHAAAPAHPLPGADAPASDDPKAFAQHLSSCMHQRGETPSWDAWHVEALLAREGIATLPGPLPDAPLAKVLLDHTARLGRNGAVDVVMPAFTSQYFLGALRDAAARGIPVRILLDARILRASGGLVHAWTFYRDYIRNAGLEVRFIVMDGDALMHHKAALFRNVDSGAHRAVVGSGRATTAALRDNYENDYVISDRASVGSLLRSFDAMWAQGMPEGAAADQVRGRAQGVEIP